jgi:competence protein ComEA
MENTQPSAALQRLVAPLAGLLFGLVVSALFMVLLRAPRGQAVAVLPPPTAGPAATAAPVRVYVSGAVAAPGVYTLPPASIAQDALDAAGGALAGADLAHLNLAQLVRDGDALYVPRVGEAEPTATRAAPGTLPPGTQIDLNTATAEQFDQLPKIGPSTAQRIVDYRTEHGGFQSVDELNAVSGIGDSTLAAIRDYVCVCTPAPQP